MTICHTDILPVYAGGQTTGLADPSSRCHTAGKGNKAR